jgi:hypothetical protein
MIVPIKKNKQTLKTTQNYFTEALSFIHQIPSFAKANL